MLLPIPVDLWCGSLACSEEAYCSLNGRARALGAVKEAIAYSMAALLLAGKLGTFIQSKYISLFTCYLDVSV